MIDTAEFPNMSTLEYECQVQEVRRPDGPYIACSCVRRRNPEQTLEDLYTKCRKAYYGLG